MTKVIIWDNDEPAIVDDAICLLWRSYDEKSISNSVSIPVLVEEQAFSLRQRYLAWVYDLGEIKVNGRSITDILEARENFSYWWMSLFVEKCNFSKSPEINDIIKLFAFDSWARTRDIEELVFMGNRKDIARCLRLWCKRKKIRFVYQKQVAPLQGKPKLRLAYDRLPYFLQAFLWLIYYISERWVLRGVGKREWQTSNAKITFFSYFINLIPQSLDRKKFGSRFWTSLPDELLKAGVKTNWLHIFVKSNQVPNARSACKMVNELNENCNGMQCHIILESFLSIGVVGMILRDWFRICWVSLKLESVVSKTESEDVLIWPLVQKDWRQSLVGKTAMSNCWHFNLLEQSIKALAKQKVGVHLLENMDWEFAYLWGWKKYGHSLAIGFSHSTVRFWDLRYFFDLRSYQRNKRNPLPLPDKVAVNGLVMREILLEGGTPADSLVNVEALRYDYLGDMLQTKRNFTTRNEQPLKLLVLGDSQQYDTTLLMKLLDQAVRLLSEATDITVKSHPLCPIQSEDYPELKMNITVEPVEKLLPVTDVVYTGSMTSAAVEAYLFGVPVISLLNNNTLNFSPLRNKSGVYFVSSHDQLASLLAGWTLRESVNLNQTEDFFYLDPEIPRWKELLSIN